MRPNWPKLAETSSGSEKKNNFHTSFSLCVCVCVRACVRACARACVYVTLGTTFKDRGWSIKEIPSVRCSLGTSVSTYYTLYI